MGFFKKLFKKDETNEEQEIVSVATNQEIASKSKEEVREEIAAQLKEEIRREMEEKLRKEMREVEVEQPKEVRELVVEQPQEEVRELVVEQPKEEVREVVVEVPKEEVKEVVAEQPQEAIREVMQTPKDPSPKSQVRLFLEALQEETQKVLLTPLPDKNATYENFLENKLILKLDEVIAFYEKISRSKSFIQLSDEVEDLLAAFEAHKSLVEEQLQALKLQVEAFRRKEAVVKKEVTDYIQIVNQINDKKLKGEEFDQVKEALTPKLEAVKAKRSEFLIEEEQINATIKGELQTIEALYLKERAIAKALLPIIEKQLI